MAECAVCGFCANAPPWWEGKDRIIVASGGAYALLDKKTRRVIVRWLQQPTFINEPLDIIAFDCNCEVVSLKTGQSVRKSLRLVNYGQCLLTLGENDAIINTTHCFEMIAVGNCALNRSDTNTFTVNYWVNGDFEEGPTFVFEDIETAWVDSENNLWVCNDTTPWQKMCATKLKK